MSDFRCPRCGGRLVLRTAKAGSKPGSQFYGCSNYSDCKYTFDFWPSCLIIIIVKPEECLVKFMLKFDIV